MDLEQEITARVQAAFEGAQINVDLDGNRATIDVVSEVFADLSRVKRQQAVYASINEYIADGRLHAVTIRARTP